MTIEDVKKLEHVVVTVDAVGMVAIKAEDGYSLAHSWEEEVPVMSEPGLNEDDEVAEVTEKKLMTEYVKAVYCREETMLPEYYVVER